jgi:mycofactocin system glycosyltransferase
MVTELGRDPSVRVVDGGRVLIGGSPLRVVRLTEAGARVVADLDAGHPLPDGRPVARLVDRLVDAGILHPRPTSGPWSPADVVVVVPARGRGPRVASAPGDPSVLVVDDGSDPPLDLAATDAATATLRRDRSGGPAAARNTGWRATTAPLVAFVDADCAPAPGWLDALLPHFADPQVAAVAPRVASEPGAGTLARYEERHSPLDLGVVEGRVAPMTRISYVPATALVVRRSALEEAGGFDEDLRFGEDVDLVWRLVASGHRVRYDPRSVVVHEPRRTLAGWARQRFDYGASAGPLAVRHPGALAPVVVSGWSVLAWGLLAARRPAAGLAVAGATTALLARKLRALDDPAREAARLGLLGHLHAGHALAQAVTRAWLPLAVAAAVPSRTARRALAGALLARALVGDAEPPVSRALRLLDDASYCAGVWTGCWRARTLGPLRPALGSWPGRTRVPEPAVSGS